MKLIATIFLSLLLFSFEDKKEIKDIQYRSFYSEMKALEKPPKVTAFSTVQTASNQANSANTCSVTISSSGANNLIVVSVLLLAANSITSITDNVGHTYVLGSTYAVATFFTTAHGYGFQTTGGTTSVTVTVSGNTDICVIVDEYSGFTGTPTNAECYDTGNAGTTNTAGVSIQTPGFSPINTGCLIVTSGYELGVAPNLSASSGFTHLGTGSYYGTPYFSSYYKLSGTMSEDGKILNPDAYTGYSYVFAKSFKQENATPPPSAGKAIRSSSFKP